MTANKIFSLLVIEELGSPQTVLVAALDQDYYNYYDVIGLPYYTKFRGSKTNTHFFSEIPTLTR